LKITWGVITISDWKFLANHGLVLSHLARNPSVKDRELGNARGITERAARKIITDHTEAQLTGIAESWIMRVKMAQTQAEPHEPSYQNCGAPRQMLMRLKYR